MPDAAVLIQYVTFQRMLKPVGRRVLQDGVVQIVGEENALPGPNDVLEKDRVLTWVNERQLTNEDLQKVKHAITDSGIFDLPGRLLISYCKDDPGTQIWTVNLDGQIHRVVLYDPKPRRSAELDKLLAALVPLIGN